MGKKLVKNIEDENEKTVAEQPAYEGKLDNFIVYGIFWTLLVLSPLLSALYAFFLRYNETKKHPESEKFMNIKTISIIVSAIYILVILTIKVFPIHIFVK